MATSEVDLSVRISTIDVLKQIDKHGLLEDEQRDRIGRLIFERERRVRKEVGAFFGALVEEQVEEKLGELQAGEGGELDEEEEDKRRKRLGWKFLAGLLVKFGRELDGLAPAGMEDEDEDETGGGGDDETTRENLNRDLVGGAITETHKGRVALAVESLWDQMTLVRDWEGMVEYLLLDHTEVEVDGEDEDMDATPRAKGKGRKAKGKKGGKGEQLGKEYQLEEEEESVLLEVFVAALGKAGSTSLSAFKKVCFCSNYSSRWRVFER